MNYLLNELVDILEKEAKTNGVKTPHQEQANNGISNGSINGSQERPITTWVHKLFQVNQSCFVTIAFFIETIADMLTRSALFSGHINK